MQIESKNLLVAVKAYARGNALPLDKDEVWEDLTSAQAYAKSATAYAGQTIKVLEDGKYKSYVLDGEAGAFTLSPVGDVQIEDLKTYVHFVQSLPSEANENEIYIEQDTYKGYLYNSGIWCPIFDLIGVRDDVDKLKVDITKKAPIDSPTFTGTVTLPANPSTSMEAATKRYVDDLVANLKNNTPMIATQSIDLVTNFANAYYTAGQSWRVAEEGTYVGQKCEVGDLIICIKDSNSVNETKTVTVLNTKETPIEINSKDNVLTITNVSGVANNFNFYVYDGDSSNPIENGKSIAELKKELPKSYTIESGKARLFISGSSGTASVDVSYRLATDGSVANSNDDFIVMQANIDGAVTGPDSAIVGNITVFDNANGKVIKDSKVTLASLNNIISAVNKMTSNLNSSNIDNLYKFSSHPLSGYSNSYFPNSSNIFSSEYFTRVTNISSSNLGNVYNSSNDLQIFDGQQKLVNISQMRRDLDDLESNTTVSIVEF